MKTPCDKSEPRAKKPSTLLRMIVMLLAAGLLFGGIFGYKFWSMNKFMQAMASQKMPPATVSAIAAKLSEWRPQLKAIGTLRAVQGVKVTSEINGMVQTVHFTSGDTVTAGQPLVQLNAEEDIAELRSKEAEAELARIVYERDKKQAKLQAVSQAVLDTDAADLKSKLALVAQHQAIVDKKTIRAPFAGQLGINTVNVGQYVNPGEEIVTLQSLDTLYADFHLPQQEFPALATGQAITATTDAYPGRTFSGKISTLNPEIDRETRNIRIEATIANSDHALLPGMFASVAVQAGASKKLLTVPQTAVTYNPYGETVFLLKESGKDPEGKPLLVANQVFVGTGGTRGDQVAIVKGIKEGDLVVTSGQMKLKNDSPVVVNNTIAPSNDPAPKPADE